MSSKILYTWQRLEQDAVHLADKIGEGKYDAIIAITRGGLIPAYYLARLLNIKVIHTLSLSSYEEEQRGTIVFHSIQGISLQIDSEIIEQKKVLFVDDIVDSGETIRTIRKLYPEAPFATLVSRGNLDPEYFVAHEHAWVEFPWEAGSRLTD